MDLERKIKEEPLDDSTVDDDMVFDVANAPIEAQVIYTENFGWTLCLEVLVVAQLGNT